ncbi:hypothetical protein [Hamadaea tsunoensis]|uniref:hypothetical protein n=1 Tax=Hamadaea tsunoensis TaxID=53368 RepID=UPI0003FF3774|nr:hypothetical protein [Hamadaea tsunoensis]
MLRRLLAVFLAVPLAVPLAAVSLTGCTAPHMPTGPEPTGAAPEPVPSGVLYGRVLRQDGRAATRSTVTAFQLSDEDIVRTGAAVVSLGFFCLVPDFCPRSVSATVEPTGEYAFPADKMKPVPHVTVTARHAAESGQATGPAVVVSFDRAQGRQRVPDLRFWEPSITVRTTGADTSADTGAVVTWTGFPGGADYALWTVTGTDSPQPTGVTTRETSARLDLRPFEDLPTALIVVASTRSPADGEIAQGDFAYHSGSVALPSAGGPPSREHPCSLGDPGGRLTAAAMPCPLTDGDLDTNAVVAAPCATSSCATVTRHRICVDLGTPRPVSLVAYRTPFLTEGTIVELSGDGTHFHRAGNVTDSGGLHIARIAPAQTARLACVRNDRFGFAGAILNEISVW